MGPTNGNHYCVALLQADGRYDLEHGANGGDAGDLFHAEGVNYLGPSEHPVRGPFPNTDSYQSGYVKQTGITIKNISTAGKTMQFEVVFAEQDHSVGELMTVGDESMTMLEINVDKKPQTSLDRMGRLIQDLNGVLYDFDHDVKEPQV